MRTKKPCIVYGILIPFRHTLVSTFCLEPERGLYSQGLYRNVENECGLEFVMNYEIAIHFQLL